MTLTETRGPERAEGSCRDCGWRVWGRPKAVALEARTHTEQEKHRARVRAINWTFFTPK